MDSFDDGGDHTTGRVEFKDGLPTRDSLFFPGPNMESALPVKGAHPGNSANPGNRPRTASKRDSAYHKVILVKTLISRLSVSQHLANIYHPTKKQRWNHG